MSFTEAISSCFHQYVGFKGRARRSEYWYFVLFNVIVTAIATAIANGTGATFISAIVSLALVLPGLSVDVRRLHDIGKSGWFVLLALIPLVGAIILIVWCCKDSAPDNQYGPNPKNSFNPVM